MTDFNNPDMQRAVRLGRNEEWADRHLPQVRVAAALLANGDNIIENIIRDNGDDGADGLRSLRTTREHLLELADMILRAETRVEAVLQKLIRQRLH